jgi:protein-S-isoprenylcysteine O-methyltransferase Ste14
MPPSLNLLGWIACIVYSSIPSFWVLIHPWAEQWRSRRASPYFALLPAWIGMWAALGVCTFRWRSFAIHRTPWSWIPATLFFVAGLWLYSQSRKGFSARQLGGLPEVVAGHREQRLVTSGIRARVRHPVYLAHLCEMLAWSIATGLAVCYGLTAFAVMTGVIMIRLEDHELERRFGEAFRQYRQSVPALLPRI